MWSPKPATILVPVPIHCQRKVKEGLEEDIVTGVLERVPIGEPTTWLYRMVLVPKKYGEPRYCVDLQPLNGAAWRERFIIASRPSAGFWQES